MRPKLIFRISERAQTTLSVRLEYCSVGVGFARNCEHKAPVLLASGTSRSSSFLWYGDHRNCIDRLLIDITCCNYSFHFLSFPLINSFSKRIDPFFFIYLWVRITKEVFFVRMNFLQAKTLGFHILQQCNALIALFSTSF